MPHPLRFTLTLLAAAALLTCHQSAVQADTIQSGFNDSTGINSDGAPNSPFTLDSSLQGQGGAEPGWAAPWVVSPGSAEVLSVSGGFEGDGAAAFFGNTAAATRAVASPLESRFRVTFRVMIPGPITRDVIFRVQDSTGQGVNAIAVQINVESDFRVRVVDGGSVEETGIFLTPGTFHNVTVEVDPVTKTWIFFLDGVQFNAPDPLDFRGNPAQVDEVQFLNEIAAPNGSFLDAVIVETEIDKLSPEEQIIQTAADILDLIAADPENEDLADKLEDVLSELMDALVELEKTPPDNQAALGKIEGAVGDLEAAIEDELVDAVVGFDLMDQLTGVAREIADNAITTAINLGGDADEIDEALESLDEGDALRLLGEFKDAVSAYKDALAKAEGAL